MDQNTKNRTSCELKTRLMSEDREDLREHRPELYEQLHEAVCEESVETRITDLEAAVRTLKTRIEYLENTNTNE